MYIRERTRMAQRQFYVANVFSRYYCVTIPYVGALTFLWSSYYVYYMYSVFLMNLLAAQSFSLAMQVFAEHIFD